MRSPSPVHPECLVVFVVIVVLAAGIPIASASTSDLPASEDSFFSDTATVPRAVSELMQTSRSKYLEGSTLIKAGDSDGARRCFDEAVDLLLRSEWDLTSTPVLNRFFQDLVRRIQQDESRYLLAAVAPSEELEEAVIDKLEILDKSPATVDPSLKDVLAADIDKTTYEIPITMNEMVMKSLDFWLKSGREYFIDGLVRSGKYRPIIEKVFREESIPLDLMYLAQVESLFKPHAYSKAKAKGIWQFGKDTALRYGLKVTRDVDERSDPEKSTRAAARYLNDLFAIFKDWNLALAAYNWGEGKVQRLIDSTGLKDFWQLVDLKRRLPEETRNHIPLIQASVILAKNAEKYGLPTKLDPPLKYVEVSVSKPTDLRAAAKVLSTSLEELKKLNPALRGFTTPANYPNFRLKIPENTDPATHQYLASLPLAKFRGPHDMEGRHRIRPGETLGGIAERYGISVPALCKANRLSRKSTIRAGSFLSVPSQAGSKSAGAEKIAANSGKKAKTPKTLKKSRSGKSTSARAGERQKKSARTKTAKKKEKKGQERSEQAAVKVR